MPLAIGISKRWWQSEASRLIIAHWIAGLLSTRLKRLSIKRRDVQVIDGEWTRPISRLKASGNIITELSISREIPSTSSSPPSKRDKAAALRYFTKAIERNGKPGLVNIDKSGSNKAALTQFNEDNNKRVKVRQCKYLNNIIEQDHRRIKRLTRPMLGFKNFNSAQSTLAGIELVAMIKKGQMKKNISRNLSFADQFYALAA